MKTFRTISALALGFALLVPAPALAQHVRVFDGTTHAFVVPAAPNHEVRVTVHNPKLVAPIGEDEAQVDFYLKLHGVDGDVTHTIDPGAAYTFVIDPRSTGHVVDERTGLRHVPVSFHVEVEVIEGRRTPEPAVTIELVNTRTREAHTFVAYGGFTGGVYVASGDVN